jgi:hypothetical protein
MSNENDLIGVNGMGNVFGVIPDGNILDTGSNLTDEQAKQLSRFSVLH